QGRGRLHPASLGSRRVRRTVAPRRPQACGLAGPRRAGVRWHGVMTTTIRVGDPRELLAYLPYRLGFHPRRSVVVVSVRAARGRVGLVARVDLDDLADPERGATVASGLANHVWRDGAERAVVVVYDDDVAAGASAAVEAAVGRAGQGFESGVSRTEAGLGDRERFRGVHRRGPWC